MAIVALALHVIHADGVVEEKENQVLESEIRNYFNLSKGEYDEMLAAAKQQEERAIDLFRFTSRINRALDERQKTEFIGLLWQIVHADEQRNEIEDHLVWRIAELIGVSGRVRIAQRQEAEQANKGE
ncbi:TerB family tellurite resistance protein [Rhizobium sp. TH2]|uniref:tellurite resistance TerB family protein n=1 Tax=Rhizobium sp. TH2 TaxID=2775403 RepID=UPI0021574B81|nr:TerB family tellurite resistance protein [Rhizobium sp. TH2]